MSIDLHNIKLGDICLDQYKTEWQHVGIIKHGNFPSQWIFARNFAKQCGIDGYKKWEVNCIELIMFNFNGTPTQHFIDETIPHGDIQLKKIKGLS